jgi:hypothetical protein
MGHRVQRLGLNLGRGWTLLLLVIGLLLAAAFWIGPLRPWPAELELVMMHGDDVVDVYEARGLLGPQRTVRFGVPLTVRNVGAQPARPQAVMLSVPARFHLSTTRGRLRGEVAAGVPLRRYVVNVPDQRIDPDGAPVVLPGLDTIWIEPDLPAQTCVLRDGVPEFMPASQHDASSLADVRIFYSIVTGRASERHSGLLEVRVDPRLIRTQPAPPPQLSRTVFLAPGAELPALGRMRTLGARTAHCGDPEQPVELYTVTSETQTGRFYVIYIDGTARKHLYDLNGDGFVDLETWDGDGDGRFEARRDVRYAVPEFVQQRPPRDPRMLLPDTARPSPEFLALFDARGDGPWRFGDRLRADSVAAEAQRAAAEAELAAQAARARAAAADQENVADVEPPDSAWLALFNDVAAGPFRFSARARAVAPVPVEPGEPADAALPEPTPLSPFATPADTAAAAAAAARAAADTAAADTASPPPPRPRREPIGTPVPVPPRRDTIPL